MTKIEAIIFDAGGVLHESNTAMADDLRKELGVTDEILRQIEAKQMQLLGTGAIDEAEFWRRVTREHGLRDVAITENLLGRAFIAALVEHAPMTELIKELRARGIKLAVLSNTTQPHASALRKAGLYDGFDHVILSCEVGILKPDHAIYQHALDVLDVRPEATLFVDDVRKNIEAAQALGIKSILYTDTHTVVSEIRSLVSGD